MQSRRQWTAAVAAFLLLAASASAASLTPGQQQQRQVDHACLETLANVQQAVQRAPDARITAIHSHLQVVIPGRLTGQIEFSAVRGQISLVRRRAASAPIATLGCDYAAAHPAATAAYRVVSTVHRQFTQPGRYELTFTLNSAGRQILGRLAAADHAYYEQHPHGQSPPTLSFGATLTYTPAG